MATKEYLPSEGRKWRNDVEDTSQYLNYKGHGPGIVPDGADAGPLYEALGEAMGIAARKVATKWHNLLEADEILSELWIEILESDATEKELRDADPDLLVDLLVRMSDRICIGERDDYEHFTGNYRYSVNEAKILVEEYFLASGEELMVELIDVDVALEQILEEDDAIKEKHPADPRGYYEALVKRYAMGQIPARTGGEMQKLSRALTKLTDHMNRNFKNREFEYSGIGSRTRMPRGYDPYEG